MWKAITTSLCALMFYSAVPSPDKVVIPPGKEHHFDYVLRGPDYLLKPDLGSVVWDFKSNVSDKELVIKSYFEIKTESELVLSIIGVNGASIRSISRCDDLQCLLSRYSYQLLKKSADQKRNQMIEQPIFRLQFQQDKAEQKTYTKRECQKLAGENYVSVSCGDKPSGTVPDLFAVLAAVVYASDLENRVQEKQEWAAVYGRQEGTVSLEKVREKIITRKKLALPVILYSVKNIATLLGMQKENKNENSKETETIALRLGLRKEHPHFLEYAEIETDFGTLTLERKE